MQRFLDLADFKREDVEALIALARRLEQRPEPQALAGKILGLVFFNPSLRTLASMQAGMARLGGTSFVIAPGQGTWQLEMRDGVAMTGVAAEHVREGMGALSGYCDALGVRMFADGRNLEADLAETAFNAIDRAVSKPLINLESAMNHPCQALADWKTMDDLELPRGAKFVLSWVYHPRALPLAVPAATLHMAAMRGMETVVLRPDGYALPDAVMAKARKAAEASGGSVRETSDRREALEGAHVLYAKEWGSPRHYGDTASESQLRVGLTDWCVREEWFAPARKDARFMHCLPVRRNSAVADEILDGSRSVVLREAHNRMSVQMAVLHQLLEGSTNR